MNKKKFLEALENELIHNRCQDIDSVLEYYDELIEDKKEAGKKEKDIISTLDIDEIIKNIKIEQRINKAVEKPNLSNGLKALIATLSVLSIPLLIPIGAMIFACVIVVLSLFFALIVTVGAVIFSGGLSIVACVWGIITGKLAFATALFWLGISLVGIGLFNSLLKWTLNICKDFIAWIAGSLKARFHNQRKENANE